MTLRRVKILSVVLALSVLLLVSCQPATAPPNHENIATEWYDVATHFYRYPPDDPRPETYGKISIRPGLWLVIKKSNLGYNTIYFVRKGAVGRLLAGSSDHAEIELVTSDVVQFMTYSSSDGFHYFPDRRTYDVKKDELTQDFLYWDCAEPFRFNYDVNSDGNEPSHYVGHEVLDIAGDGDSVTITFSSSSPAPEYWKWDRPPETFTTFDKSASTFNLLFVGSNASQETIEKAGALGPTEACNSFSLEQTPEGARLSIGLTKPMEYRAGAMEYSARHHWDPVAEGFSMTIWLRDK